MNPEHRATLRLALSQIFSTGNTVAIVSELEADIDELVLRAADERVSELRAQQETARLSTAQPSRPHGDSCMCGLCTEYDHDRARELAPRSGALEPEEKTDETKRSGG